MAVLGALLCVGGLFWYSAEVWVVTGGVMAIWSSKQLDRNLYLVLEDDRA